MWENPFLKKGGFPTPFPQKLLVGARKQLHTSPCRNLYRNESPPLQNTVKCKRIVVLLTSFFLFVAQMKSICYYFILQQLGRFVNPFCAKIWLRVNLAITNNPKITLVFDNINCHAKFARPFSALRRLAKRIQAIVTCRNSAVQLALPSAQINANNCIIEKKMIQYT